MNRQPPRQPDIKQPSGDRLDQALAFVRRQLDASASLPDDPPFNDDYTKWARVTSAGIKDHFGADSDQHSWLAHADLGPVQLVIGRANALAARRQKYEKELNDKRVGLESILAHYEALGPPSGDEPTAVRRAARAFISHGGENPSLTRVQDFLRALGVEPIVVEKRASEGRELHENVDSYRKQSDFAVILLTNDIQDAGGVWHPSGSVEVEVGELKTEFGNRMIYLKEEAVKLPAMVSTLVHETFTEDNMGQAYMKIVTELHGWGWLTVSPPEGGVG